MALFHFRKMIASYGLEMMKKLNLNWLIIDSMVILMVLSMVMTIVAVTGAGLEATAKAIFMVF